MENPLSKYLTGDGLVQDEFLEQLAFNEKMAELGLLATGMVHELNTPLSVIVSAAQMILREQELSEFVKEMVERIDQEAQRLSQFTRGLLSFTRHDAGGEGEADVNRVLREVMAFLRYEAQKRSITVVEELDYQLPFLPAGSNRLKQIFINLVMNALQAMEYGGTLLIRSSLDEQERITIRIADTGPGIPEDALTRIFEPFYTTKEPGEGTGLGLFITRNLVTLLGGRIEVASRLGEGTVFTITFPAP